MAEAIVEGREALDHHQVPQAWVLAVLTQLGRLAVCASAVLTGLAVALVLALVPFAILGGAIAVRDRIDLRFRVVAVPLRPTPGARHAARATD